MRAATAELTQQLQRWPVDAEVAELLQVGIADLAQAHLADTALGRIRVRGPCLFYLARRLREY